MKYINKNPTAIFNNCITLAWKNSLAKLPTKAISVKKKIVDINAPKPKE